MVVFLRNYILLLIMLTLAGTLKAQSHIISEVRSNESSVFVGQPVSITVAVYSSTWFTKGLDPGNIKVNGAFTVYFRSVSNSKNINGKTYAGVEMIFNVFPYDDEDITFPSLTITVETPDEGDYKGVNRSVVTKSLNIRVKAVPDGFEKDQWLVASGLTVKESWVGDKTSVKVGDVLERSITLNADGTVSELIPPVNWDTIQSVSLYPSQSEVKTNKTRTDISATRSDGIRYLFEKEGEIVIPEMVFSWWNANHKKLYKRTLKSHTFNVLPNPDLGMLETIKDSMALVNPSIAEGSNEETPILIFGLSLRDLIIVIVISMIAILILSKMGLWLFHYFKKRRLAYLYSESYFFHQFVLANRKTDSKETINALYLWIDQLKLNEPTLQYFAKSFGNKALVDEVEMINSNNSRSLKLKTKIWSEARKTFLDKKKNEARAELPFQLNP